jgi:hypothetical protein
MPAHAEDFKAVRGQWYDTATNTSVATLSEADPRRQRIHEAAQACGMRVEDGKPWVPRGYNDCMGTHGFNFIEN